MRKLSIFLLPLTVFIACAAFVFAPYNLKTAKATEIDYDAYDEVEIVSIAPPYYFETTLSVVFKVYFSTYITHENYKHMAMSAKTLKDMINDNQWANPDLTKEKIEFLDANGVMSSIRNCVYLNGKSVDDYQKKGGAFAVQTHMGEENVNICLQLEFGSSTGLSKDLGDDYNFSFKSGLKFPSGVMLKKDSDWKFIKSDGVFEKIDDSINASNADFIINYDGKTITDTDNLITVTDKEDFSLSKLYVKPVNPNATVTVKPEFDELAKGTNYVLITCTSQNKTKNNVRQLVVKYVDEEKSGCSSSVSTGSCALLALIPVLAIRRKRK